MQIIFNDKKLTCDATCSVHQFLHQLDLLRPGSALAINQTIVPREQWETTLLHDGDQILLFQAIAGG